MTNKLYFVYYSNGANRSRISHIGTDVPVSSFGDFQPYGTIFNAGPECLEWDFLRSCIGYSDLVKSFKSIA